MRNSKSCIKSFEKFVPDDKELDNEKAIDRLAMSLNK